MEPPVRLSETELRFGYGASSSSVTLKIVNDWNTGLLFKIKTTNPERSALYHQRHQLELQTLDEHNRKDKFIVIFAPHNPPNPDAVLADLWKALEGNQQLQNSMIQRRFVCRGGDLHGQREDREWVFVTSPNEHLLCPICQDVFDDPAITGCGHTFCRSCLQSAVLRQNYSCPLCRTLLTKTDRGDVAAPPNLLIKSQVAELKVHCKFGVKQVGQKWEADPSGCPEVITLDSRAPHYAHCKFKPKDVSDDDLSTSMSKLSVQSTK